MLDPIARSPLVQGPWRMSSSSRPGQTGAVLIARIHSSMSSEGCASLSNSAAAIFHFLMPIRSSLMQRQTMQVPELAVLLCFAHRLCLSRLLIQGDKHATMAPPFILENRHLLTPEVSARPSSLGAPLCAQAISRKHLMHHLVCNLVHERGTCLTGI